MQHSDPAAPDPDGQVKKLTTIEQVYDEIGGFGRFQVFAIILVTSLTLVFGYSMLLMSYAGYISEFECVVLPESARQSRSAVYTNRSPQLETGSGRVHNDSTLNVCRVNGTECHDFRFLGSKRTVISEWNLVCDSRWLKATIISIQMGGVMLGSIVGGFTGDYFGRRKTLYGSVLLHVTLNIMAAFSLSWQMFATLRFLIGLVMGGGIAVEYYPVEFLPTRWRHVVPLIPCWPLGMMAFAGTAWCLEDWSQLHIATALLGATLILGYFYIPESPRWLATQGRLTESMAALEKIARTNNKALPPSARKVLENIASKKKVGDKGRKFTYLDLFKTRQSARTTLTFGFLWVTLAVTYYGINFAVSSFAGNLYLNMFVMSVVQMPSFCVPFFIIDRLGRRLTCLILTGILLLVGISCVLLHIAAPENIRDQGINSVCLLASMVSVACWVSSETWVTENYPTVTSHQVGGPNRAESHPTVTRQVDLTERRTILQSPGGPNRAENYPTVTRQVDLTERRTILQSPGGANRVESYPTVTRTLGFGFASVSARVGSAMAPFLINLDEWPLLSFSLVTAIDLVAFCLLFFIPETSKVALMETLYEIRVNHYDLDPSDTIHSEPTPENLQHDTNCQDEIA
ncbi:hypothetical protein RRG08_020040 [Elysia crispata]|uniref:Major facilitator superfamily (MFS) profile domain-containing protein n=1 Tax=Elysia crispata TaxID=231223 RepID=A0AAE1BBF1_9GAST|nr:hypothetical protein RRG08_020040 [Elysia crispata]